MKALFKALILVPLILAVVGLSVANRAPVDVSLDPFALSLTDLRLTAPLFVVILGAVALGALIGGVAAWIVQGKHRRAARARGLEAHKLRAEVDRLRVDGPVARV
jgi:uncharacterized integral membrane protein